MADRINSETAELLADAESIFSCITKTLINRQLHITAMESCTAGLIASLITDTEGSSRIMKGSFVTYSNEAKILQGVPAETIRTYGVYSHETAEAMAQAACNAYGAEIGIGVTGSFGNVDPANPDSVIGEVYYAIRSGACTESFTLKIPEQDSRLAYKLVTAKAVGSELCRILGI